MLAGDKKADTTCCQVVSVQPMGRPFQDKKVTPQYRAISGVDPEVASGCWLSASVLPVPTRGQADTSTPHHQAPMVKTLARPVF